MSPLLLFNLTQLPISIVVPLNGRFWEEAGKGLAELELERNSRNSKLRDDALELVKFYPTG
jgi:hypothetical protein